MTLSGTTPATLSLTTALMTGDPSCYSLGLTVTAPGTGGTTIADPDAAVTEAKGTIRFNTSTPVPEAASLALLGVRLLGLGAPQASPHLIA